MSGRFDVSIDTRGVARLTVVHDAKLNTLNPALLPVKVNAPLSAGLILAPWRRWKHRQKRKPSFAACMAFVLPFGICRCR
jgi:hypothetical protein